ncbi:nucleotidyltransferase [Iodobacter ciconiae]|uniref:Nucleotidyltransferase n=1 Tax=Iodobacter ciconiae TaxID=2496266 RepID=A0A3S8ZW26_9NEIS|nr:nucleotidyltransferase [Iodobacter ciconiae]AZN37703.1 nucleotidyltransferase [Iodobacter ciconiae]
MSKPYVLDRQSSVLRAQIAERAARLIAEDLLHDFALAKKKAAKQLGISEGRMMPSNQEIETALANYRAVYYPEHSNHLNSLRQKALKVMRILAHFHPYLTGSVLSGVAGSNSDINLILFLDDPKSAEIFLLNQQIDYDILPPANGRQLADYPSLTFWFDDSQVSLHVRPRDAERQKEERMRLEELEVFLSASS